MRAHNLLAPAAAAAIAAGVWCPLPRSAGVFPLDDAYIHLVYARNLANGLGFCFNPGEASLGTSSPLWVLLLAGLSRLGADPFWSALICGGIAFAASAALASDLARIAAERAGLTRPLSLLVSLLAGLLVAGNGSLQWLAHSGMETSAFQALCLLTVRAYLGHGLSAGTGLLAGLAALARLQGGLLALVLAGIDLARGRRRWWRGLAVAGAVVASYLVMMVAITGSPIPTPSTGKLLTFVGGGINLGEMRWFLSALLAYQRYLPQNLVLAAAALWAAGTAWRARRREQPRARLIEQQLPAITLAAWGSAHLALYLVAARSVTGQTRYLAEEYIILAILGSLALGFMASRRARLSRLLSGAAVVTVLALTATRLPAWRRALALDLEHMARVDVALARWVREHTPGTARVASFDIGALGYLSGRYVVDLGGLIDPEIHPSLRERSCAGYVRRRRADYIVYLRSPDPDPLFGISRALAGGDYVLRQELLASFAIPPQPVPCLTQPFAADLYRITGWYAAHGAALAKGLAWDGEPAIGLSAQQTGPLRIVGASVRPTSAFRISGVPSTVAVTLAYQAVAPLPPRMWLQLVLRDPSTGSVIHTERRCVGHERLRLAAWPPTQLLRQELLVFLPDVLPEGELELAALVSDTELVPFRGLRRAKLVPLGRFSLSPASTDFIEPWRLRNCSQDLREPKELAILTHFPPFHAVEGDGGGGGD